jgi:hypothetical protein
MPGMSRETAPASAGQLDDAHRSGRPDRRPAALHRGAAPGWQAGGADISSGKARLWLDSDRAGPRAVAITLTATCDTSGAEQVPPDQSGTRRFERPLSLAGQRMIDSRTDGRRHPYLCV